MERFFNRMLQNEYGDCADNGPLFVNNVIIPPCYNAVNKTIAMNNCDNMIGSMQGFLNRVL